MKLATGLILILSVSLIFLSMKPAVKIEEIFIENNDNELKQNAFNVLKNVCNKCHIKQNPFKIFTLQNMERLAPKIETQVFELKRMPKGKTPLTQNQKESLKSWINSLK